MTSLKSLSTSNFAPRASLLRSSFPCPLLSFTHRKMSVGTPTTFAQLDVAKEVKIDVRSLSFIFPRSTVDHKSYTISTLSFSPQHDNVRDLLERYQTASNLEEKKPIASTLVREMAIHSDAEEVSVYNLFLAKNMVTEAEKDKGQYLPTSFSNSSNLNIRRRGLARSSFCRSVKRSTLKSRRWSTKPIRRAWRVPTTIRSSSTPSKPSSFTQRRRRTFSFQSSFRCSLRRRTP